MLYRQPLHLISRLQWCISKNHWVIIVVSWGVLTINTSWIWIKLRKMRVHQWIIWWFLNLPRLKKIKAGLEFFLTIQDAGKTQKILYRTLLVISRSWGGKNKNYTRRILYSRVYFSRRTNWDGQMALILRTWEVLVCCFKTSTFSFFVQYFFF